MVCKDLEMLKEKSIWKKFKGDVQVELVSGNNPEHSSSTRHITYHYHPHFFVDTYKRLTATTVFLNTDKKLLL